MYMYIVCVPVYVQLAIHNTCSLTRTHVLHVPFQISKIDVLWNFTHKQTNHSYSTYLPYMLHCIIEGVRARVSQPSIYVQLLPVCSIRTYLKENRQELYIEGWPTLTLTPSIILYSIWEIIC